MAELPVEISDFVFGHCERTLFVDGKQLVVASGAQLPPICVRTAQPVNEQDMVRKDFYWYPPALLILAFLSLPIFFIVYFAMRKKCTIVYGLHRSVRRKYSRRVIIKLVLAIVLFFAIFFAAATNSPVIIISVLVAFLATIISFLIGNRPLNVKNQMNGKFWFVGCSPEYLEVVSKFAG